MSARTAIRGLLPYVIAIVSGLPRISDRRVLRSLPVSFRVMRAFRT